LVNNIKFCTWTFHNGMDSLHNKNALNLAQVLHNLYDWKKNQNVHILHFSSHFLDISFPWTKR
jgi:3-methyladenine DNA glycosylase AlkC